MKNKRTKIGCAKTQLPLPIFICLLCKQRGVMVRSIVFKTAMIARLMVQLVPGLVGAHLNEMLLDNYSCLMESNKQQIKAVRSKTQPENLETKCNS